MFKEILWPLAILCVALFFMGGGITLIVQEGIKRKKWAGINVIIVAFCIAALLIREVCVIPVRSNPVIKIVPTAIVKTNGVAAVLLINDDIQKNWILRDWEHYSSTNLCVEKFTGLNLFGFKTLKYKVGK